MKITFSCILCILIFSSGALQAGIYKCIVAGKLVFTDKPCDGEVVTLCVTNSMSAEETLFVYESLKTAYNINKWYYGHSGYK